MRARSLSHAGITVSDFNKAVRFYSDIFGCPLVGVADTPSDRVRSFFGVNAEQRSLEDIATPLTAITTPQEGQARAPAT